MREHLHTGPVTFIYAGLAALVFIHILRIVALQLADNPATAGAGKALGAFALAD